ncbi:uncharacterized protein MYCFIDRAFT_79363 [Pseudocercospora fijiensis CIRAD86]|uniref:Protein HRI1 n=1 Tax=Pseudocercospora fijiensis (strain CIRAD86) TaxID=383855 RepID=M3A180_PSEFD|nr:uncharacterized protein MYCFIDRAFT_79363 [Pseudocercospora fijiensis CIRAD86]EME78146.1 hypothetical protein MYCFIDRAFT_79363 [Pseudocercospora fijiensis CIRAD86]
MPPPSESQSKRFFPPPPDPSIFSLPLDHETRDCHLTSILAHKNSHYLYEVSFSGSRSGWRGKIQVPEEKLDRGAQRAWKTHCTSAPLNGAGSVLKIPKSEDTKGVARFLDLVSETTSPGSGKEIYVRGLEVEFKGAKYSGEVVLLKDDPAIKEMVGWARDRLDARESIEEGDGDGSGEGHVHTVEFFGAAPRKGRKSEVEIWELEGGEVLFAGKASVRGFEEGEDGRRELVIEVRIEGERYFLRGELGERMKVGRFLVVKQDEV